MSRLEPVWPPAAKNLSMSNRRFKGGYLLAFAAVFHLIVTLSIVIASRFGLVSSVFDERGLGVSFASDTRIYFGHVTELIEILRSDGWAAWFSASFPSHTKLYSLSAAAFGPLVGYNILAIEPLNLVCYLAILAVVFKLGREVFSSGVGLVAAAIVGLWPSLLLHTTQVLKDPIFLACLLSLILLATGWLTRTLTISQGLISSISTGALVIVLWVIKPDSWELALIVGVLTVTFVLLRSIAARTISNGNAIAGISLVIAMLAVPFAVTRYFNPETYPFLTENAEQLKRQETTGVAPGEVKAIKPPSETSKGLTRLREKITWARYLYETYPVKGSNIDGNVRLESWGEIIRYLPRATVIGLFAPFPNLWLGSGAQVGRSGRLLAGAETLVMYVGYFLIAISLWMRRGKLAVWFLISIASAGVVALSLVVINVGTLYRLRFPFWILLIVVAVNGGFELFGILRARKVANLAANSSVP